MNSLFQQKTVQLSKLFSHGELNSSTLFLLLLPAGEIEFTESNLCRELVVVGYSSKVQKIDNRILTCPLYTSPSIPRLKMEFFGIENIVYAKVQGFSILHQENGPQEVHYIHFQINQLFQTKSFNRQWSHQQGHIIEIEQEAEDRQQILMLLKFAPHKRHTSFKFHAMVHNILNKSCIHKGHSDTS